jgi:hypothetical protein
MSAALAPSPVQNHSTIDGLGRVAPPTCTVLGKTAK